MWSLLLSRNTKSPCAILFRQYLTSYHMSITDNVGLCCPLPKSLLQYLTSYHMSITDNVVFVVHYPKSSLLQYLISYHMSITDNWSLLSTTKESFTIPNILPYVHHWQCGLCCPLPKSWVQYFLETGKGSEAMLINAYHLTICPSLTMWSLLSTTKESFTIPNILPYVHHWQCGLCCPLPNILLQYLTSYHM